MQKEINKYKMSPYHKWNGIDLKTPIEGIECNCRGDLQCVAKNILPIGENTQPIVVYNSCNRTLWAALLRQLRHVPKPVPKHMSKFKLFCKEFFNSSVLPHLENFDYNFNQWYNHLDSKKQLELEPYMTGDKADWDVIVYKLFCKREKQIVGDSMPKNRAIAACPAMMKFVMGPVIWALEALFKKIHGYKQSNRESKSATNWKEIEQLYTERWNKGYTYVIQGDGSAWDTSVTHDLRELPNMIYNWLADNNKIRHIDPEIFRKVATSRYRKLQANYYEDGRTKTLGTATLDGTTLSGSPDTTFANTVMMMMVQKFCMKEAGYTEDQYEHDTAGDDFAIFATHISDKLHKTYEKYWAKADSKADEYGLGIILKFLNVGDYSSLDYCSTNVIQHKDTFKIVRQINRLSPLNHWSIKALQLSKGETKQYYLDLALSVDSWAKNMPLYGDYADYFRHAASKIGDLAKPISVGKPKKILLVDPQQGKPIDYIDKQFTYYGRDFSYGYELRQSDTYIPENVVYDFILDKYGLVKADLDVYSQRLKSGTVVFDNLH